MQSADSQFLAQPVVADMIELPLDYRFCTAPRNRLERSDWQQRALYRASAVRYFPCRGDRGSNGVFGMCIHAGGELQQRVRRLFNQRNYIGHDRLAVGERASLVQRNDPDQAAIFQMYA